MTRFCHNLDLTGFHDLKIQLAQNATESVSLLILSRDDASANLELIEKNKVATITATLENVPEA